MPNVAARRRLLHVVVVVLALQALSIAAVNVASAAPTGDAVAALPPDCINLGRSSTVATAGGDHSVNVWVEVAYCNSNQLFYVRASAKNVYASGKTDWAIAIKGAVYCHTSPLTLFPPATHPHVTAGHTSATGWYTWKGDYYWAEVSTTYANGAHFAGSTTCYH